MSTAKIIAELRQLLARATGGRWFVTYTPAKEPRIETTQHSAAGQVMLAAVVVPASFTMRREDAELIVAMRTHIEGLMAAVEAKEAERLAVVHAMERAQQEHLETMQRLLAESAESANYLERAMSTHNEVMTISDRMSRDLATARGKLDRQQPLVDAVEAWARNRHSPRLLAAWDRYVSCRK